MGWQMMTRGISMWLSKGHSRQRQRKHIESELKMLRRERHQVEARGCYSDRELAAKEAELEDYDRRIQRLELERDRLRLLQETGGDRD
jgi:septal ring factor EnvC (AmiA/AmiB activator)